MIISDLNYLSDVFTSTPTGGSYGFRSKALVSQVNLALVKQDAKASSRAVSYHGDAVAVSIAENDAVILQYASIG
jgi:hypothetical protein